MSISKTKYATSSSAAVGGGGGTVGETPGSGSAVVNDSNVSGDTVSDALNSLKTTVAGKASTVNLTATNAAVEAAAAAASNAATTAANAATAASNANTTASNAATTAATATSAAAAATATANAAATKAYVDNAVSSGINGVLGQAPNTLNTLEELAAALGNNPSAIASLTGLIAAKPALAGALGGSATAPTVFGFASLAALTTWVDARIASLIAGTTPAPAPAPAADTTPRMFLAPANGATVGTQGLLDGATKFGTAGTKVGSFSLTTSNTTDGSGNTVFRFAWVAVLASLPIASFLDTSNNLPGGWDGVAYATLFTDSSGTQWRLYRQDYPNANPSPTTWNLS